jgi:amidase
VSDPTKLSALELARRVRRREVSSEELTRYFLDRIERHDAQLSAFTQVLRRRAKVYARYQDYLVRTKHPDELPTFHGVPTALKDLTPMRGTFTRLGSKAYRWFVSPVDAPTAKLVKRGGFVVLGKTATSEFGVLPVTEPSIHAPTRNPWNVEHTPGGSSGGAGAAVAAGLVPIAQGSDGGGSIRIPAAFCHLFGFKPSPGLLGNLNGAVNKLDMSVMGPLAHCVEDAAAMLDVLRGDVFSERSPTSLLAQCRVAPGRLRIKMVVETPLGDVEPAIAAAVRATAKTLENLGHHVEPIARPEGTLEEFLPLWQLMLAAVPVLGPLESQLQPVTRWLRQAGRTLDLDEVKRMQRALADRTAAMFGDADILLSPTVPVLPPRVGQYASLGPRELFEAIAPIGSLTAAFNIAWRPAANIPAGIGANGLPFGIQLGGNVDQDAQVLALAHQLEQAMPWQSRRPRAFA